MAGEHRRLIVVQLAEAFGSVVFGSLSVAVYYRTWHHMFEGSRLGDAQGKGQQETAENAGRRQHEVADFRSGGEWPVGSEVAEALRPLDWTRCMDDRVGPCDQVFQIAQKAPVRS